MKHIQIKDPTIKRMLIEHMVEQIDDGHIDHLLRAGFSPEFLDNLRHRPSRDFINLAQTPLDIQFTLSEHVLDSGLRLLDMRRSHLELREYFVIHGASRRMVCSYFKLSQDEYRGLREVLRPGRGTGGRVPMPLVEVRDAIHKEWFGIQTQMAGEPCRDRIYELHKRFDHLRIDVLQQTISEFSECIDSELELDPGTHE
ncbi:DUF2857 family protein [Diaphorobacter sp. HDW4B]|uniref:STY4526/YPO1902 family pathogenicity island replication protein n=1 Tax=Diaphorobacter sp. HDW4B TaxID=2714925 RepID=UPI00140D50C2|nr:STY4526/YPO1902 family pathogenicity island replication protein [Diaphorobacter sp. HDW4B]QIL73100.1 DUF2857 family protein [Diaphorobacter sp. HDW4B]